MDSNALWLLQTLKQISVGINTKKNKAQSYINKLRELVMLIQKPAESLDVFLKRFRLAVHTLELAGGIEVFLSMLKNIGLLDYTKAETETDATKQTEMKKVIKQARDKAWKKQVMAMLFLQNADKARYGQKYHEIDEASELGRDEFPITLTAVFDMLVIKEHCIITAHHKTNMYRNGKHGLSFVQGGGRGDGS
eukprot:3555613-Ditylum_brightwellii.AAC.1